MAPKSGRRKKSGRKRKAGRKKKAGVGSSRDKGRIVERIVADMHELQAVTVERNVFLPVLGSSRRKREIDVLVSGTLAGYPVRVAVECKNEKAAVGAPKLDAFVGKLQDVGIPPQHGIFVSSSGYTSGAIARAEAAGIRPLVLTGLDDGRLASSVAQALQSIIYLLLDVTRVTVQNTLPSVSSPEDLYVFYDEQDRPVGSLPDLVWQRWVDGGLPSTIGEHEIDLAIPSGWHTVVDGRPEPVLGASVFIRVVGLVITIRGVSEQHILLNAANSTVEKLHVTADFDCSETSCPVAMINSESELDKLDGEPGAVKLKIGRIRLPRIRLFCMYWPPSERVARALAQLMEAFLAGGPDPRPIDFTTLEGTDIGTIWEPIWGEHPSVRKKGGESG